MICNMIRPDKHYFACDSKMARSKKNVPLLPPVWCPYNYSIIIPKD